MKLLTATFHSRYVNAVFLTFLLQRNIPQMFAFLIEPYTWSKQTWGDHITNVIDYDYFPPARLRINKIIM